MRFMVEIVGKLGAQRMSGRFACVTADLALSGRNPIFFCRDVFVTRQPEWGVA